MVSGDMHRGGGIVRIRARRGRSLFAAFVMGVGLVAAPASATPVAAECNPPGADPSFRRAAPFAATVVVGTVIEVRDDGQPESRNGGPSARFTLRVARVLRGQAGARMELDYLRTRGCFKLVTAAVGDDIVLALDVPDAFPLIAANTAAWLTGTPPAFSAFEIISAPELLALFPQPQPPTEPAPLPADEEVDGPFILAVGLLVGVVALLFGRRLTRPGPPSAEPAGPMTDGPQIKRGENR